MDLAVHEIECLLKDTLDCLDISEVATHDLDTDGGAFGTDGVDNRRVMGRRTDEEAERRPCLCQREGTCGPDTCSGSASEWDDEKTGTAGGASDEDVVGSELEEIESHG